MLKSLIVALALTAAALGTASAQSLKTVKFAWNSTPQTPQIDVALKQGLFKQVGLDVQIVSFPTGREGMEALIGGQVDFAYMAEFPIATAALRQQNLRVVADISRYKGQRVIASGKTMQLASASELAGKKVGTTLGTNVEYFAHRLLAKAGAKATIVNAGPDDLLPALTRGDIDAAVMFPTFFGAAKKTLGADYRELFSDEYVLHMVIVASGNVVQKDPAAIEAFVAALVKADAAFAADRADAEATVLANMKGVMPADALRDMWKDFEFTTVLAPDLVALIADQAAWIVERGMVKADKPTAASLRGYFLDAPLKKASPASVTLP
jgi:NitT/TauT family transport system substrate-binding protein